LKRFTQLAKGFSVHIIKEDMEPLVKMENIWKRFGAVEALRGAYLDVYHGEIVGLVGDNGAGKSTLMKILTGFYAPDAGTIYFEGKPVQFRSTADSRALGIEMIYQNLALAPKQTVAENVFLGREILKKYLGGVLTVINRKAMAEETKQILQRIGLELDPYCQVSKLSGGQQQAVAIARTLSLNLSPKLIIMDEPTAALAVKEVNRVLNLIRQLKQQNISIILISHRLPDVLAVADRIFVMRRGQTVAMRHRDETTLDEIIKLIIGGDASSTHDFITN